MASNSLLALLNFSNSSASSSSSASRNDDESRNLSIDTNSPSLTYDLSHMSSSTAANDLLQAILSPKAKATDQALVGRGQGPISEVSSPSNKVQSSPLLTPAGNRDSLKSPKRNVTSVKNSNNELLDSLGGSGSRSSESKKSDETAVDNTFSHRSDQTLRQRPIGTPPGNNSNIRSELSKSPAPTVFDSANIFDILRQPVKKEAKGISKADIAYSTIGNETMTSIKTDAPVTPPFASNLATSYVINPRLHALHQLSGLHASAGFEDSISSGLKTQSQNGIPESLLDLSAPQPAGPNSLYPAKLELTPISVLTTSFTPSFYIDSEKSHCAQWPCQRVGSLQGKYALYIMSKARVRIINQENGNRHFARVNSSGIKSIITPHYGDSKASRPLFATISDTDSLSIWSLQDLVQQQEATLIANIQANDGTRFLSAHWKPKGSAEELVILQSNGSLGVVCINTLEQQNIKQVLWSQCPKAHSAVAISNGHYPVSMTISSDGSFASIIEASDSIHDSFRLRLLSLVHSNSIHTVAIPSPKSFDASSVSFSCLASQKADQVPQCLVVGYDFNHIIAFVDLATGTLKQIYRFDASGPSFSLAAWHTATSTLLLCCSIRSSIFSFRPHFGDLPRLKNNATEIAQGVGLTGAERINQATELFYRIKFGFLPCDILNLQPHLRECALPDPYSSMAIDGLAASALLIATHIGGVHSLTLPEEALKQTIISQEVMKDVISEEISGNNGKETIETGPLIISSSNFSLTDVKSNADEESKQSIESIDGRLEKSIPAEGFSIAALDIADKISLQCPGVESKKKGRKGNVKNFVHDQATRMPTSLKKNQELLDLTSEDQKKEEDQFSAATMTMITEKAINTIKEAIMNSLDVHLRKAVDDAVGRRLPKELNEMLMRPDLNHYLTRSITASILPPIQQTAMDVVSRAVAPHFESIMMDMTHRIEAKIDINMMNIRKDIVTEQSKALIDTEKKIDQINSQLSGLTQSVQLLLKQNESLAKKVDAYQSRVNASVKEASSSNGTIASIATSMLKHPVSSQVSSLHNDALTSTENRSLQQLPLSNSVLMKSAGQMTSQEIEDILLTTLSSPNIDVDLAALREALSRIENACGSPAQALSTLASKHQTSQAVTLTLLHRLVKSLNGNSEQSSVLPEIAVPWLEACAANLIPSDPSISGVLDHIKRELTTQLFNAHQRYEYKATWWTNERLTYGILQYIH